MSKLNDSSADSFIQAEKTNYNVNSKALDIEKSGDVRVEVSDYKSRGTNLGVFGRFIDGFREAKIEDHGLKKSELTEQERAAILTAKSPLKKSLKNRHLQMIAIGGSIGTGLFVGSGEILSQGGPASIIIAYSIVGTMMYFTCQALGEMVVAFPVSGSYISYIIRFVEPSWGFAMAWDYAISWMLTLPTELVAASMTVQYWTESNHQNINPAAWVAIFYTLIVVINIFGVKGYGEAEFLFGIIKVTAIVGFIIFGIIMAAGGNPQHEYIGGRYWHDPGAFHHGFKGLCSVFVTAAFSFSGTELVGLAAAESSDPARYLPKATKQVFWRITLFYLVSMAIVGCLLPYDYSGLLNLSLSETATSPFVLSIKKYGIDALPSIMNVVILIAVLSVANASVFAASRTLCSLAVMGQAPKILAYIDKKGRPIFALLFQFLIGLLCFLAASNNESTVFDWLMALGGLSAVLNWGSINLAHLRFRRALTVQGRDTSELSYTAQAGIWGSLFGLILNVLVLIGQFWVALFPLGSSPSAGAFFQAYLSLPIVVAFYIGHKLLKRNWSIFIRARDMDIDSGRREPDLEIVKREVLERKNYIAAKPFWYRIWNFWC